MKLDELDNCKNEIKLAQMKLLLFCLFAYHAPRWPCGAWGAARWDTEGARPPCPGTCWASLFSAPRNIHSQRSEGRRCSNAVKNEDSFALHDLQNHWNHIQTITIYVFRMRMCAMCRYLLREAGARHRVRVAEGRSLVHGCGHFESLPEEAVELWLHQRTTGVRHLRENICTHTHTHNYLTLPLSPLTSINTHVQDAVMSKSLASCQELI